jgi:hypothetical protein
MHWLIFPQFQHIIEPVDHLCLGCDFGLNSKFLLALVFQQFLAHLNSDHLEQFASGVKQYYPTQFTSSSALYRILRALDRYPQQSNMRWPIALLVCVFCATIGQIDG